MAGDINGTPAYRRESTARRVFRPSSHGAPNTISTVSTEDHRTGTKINFDHATSPDGSNLSRCIVSKATL